MRPTNGDLVVVPGHGLGMVRGYENTTYGEMVDIALFEGGRYQKPPARLVEDGVRRLASPALLQRALEEIRRPQQRIKGSNWKNQQKNILAAIKSRNQV